METDKPLISILLAVYEPNMGWLRDLVRSLNAQTYPRLHLHVWDDCSPTVSLAAMEAVLTEELTAFGYTLRRNSQNLGSNLTFQRLTQDAQGDYFAYCDQDDIWKPQKLERLQAVLKNENAVMTYCDMEVIDGAGELMATSLRTIRPRLCYISGANLAETYFFRNCTAGCSMLILAQAARAACPFPRQTVCDQWLAMLAARQGAVAFVDEPLVRYRIHGGNQTGILTSVFSKEDYREKRLTPLKERLECYRRYASPSPEMCAFVTARLAGHWYGIWKYRKLCKTEARFELAMWALPEPLFRWILRKVKHEA